MSEGGAGAKEGFERTPDSLSRGLCVKCVSFLCPVLREGNCQPSSVFEEGTLHYFNYGDLPNKSSGILVKRHVGEAQYFLW
ncbi:MAG TPA: hypothetical protein QF423_04445 [Candidatus Scalindua sp.]|nr:hypothetical protein [Candidatus Scalindua sp.]